MKKIVRLLFEVLLIAAIFFISFQLIQSQKKVKQFDEVLQQKEQVIAELIAKSNDYETALINTRKKIAQTEEKYFGAADIFPLDANNTKEAEEILWNSLLKEEKNIPKHPVLGGKFFFSQGAPLKGNWYLAQFEDGHIRGFAIYKYTVNNNKITWKIIDTFYE